MILRWRSGRLSTSRLIHAMRSDCASCSSGICTLSAGGSDATLSSGRQAAAPLRDQVGVPFAYKNDGQIHEISAADSRVKVLVIPTNEELVIARETAALL